MTRQFLLLLLVVVGYCLYTSRIWNGHIWETEEIVVNPGSPYSFFNAVADGDDVHVVHVVHGAGTIYADILISSEMMLTLFLCSRQ